MPVLCKDARCLKVKVTHNQHTANPTVSIMISRVFLDIQVLHIMHTELLLSHFCEMLNLKLPQNS
jgi:hypothetical protein